MPRELPAIFSCLVVLTVAVACATPVPPTNVSVSPSQAAVATVAAPTAAPSAAFTTVPGATLTPLPRDGEPIELPIPLTEATVVHTVVVTPAPATPITNTVPATPTLTLPTALPTATPYPMLVVDGMNVRSGPGTNFDIIEGGYSGKLPVLGRSGDWFKVLYGGEKEAWVNNMPGRVDCSHCSGLPVVAPPPTPDPVVVLCRQLYRPLKRYIGAIGPFGPKHPGIDIGVDLYTPVLNTTEGRVVGIGKGENGYKYGILVERPDGTYLTVSHVISPTVTVGEAVHPCQQIAVSYGGPGDSTSPGPHIQFDITENKPPYKQLITDKNWEGCWAAMQTCP